MFCMCIKKESLCLVFHSFFASAMLIAWSPMTGPSCLHTTTDICHGRPVSYHNLRQESQLIPLASGGGVFQYRPPGQEEAAPVWRTLPCSVNQIINMQNRLNMHNVHTKSGIRTEIERSYPADTSKLCIYQTRQRCHAV
jgi:hypothetical protein